MKSIILAAAMGTVAAPAMSVEFYLDAQLLNGGLTRSAPAPVTLETVLGLNSAAGTLARHFSERLSLEESGPTARAAYLISAGLAAFSFQRANAIIIGHEGAHFHAAGLHGRDDHRFVADDGTEISWIRAYRNALLSGHAEAVAESTGAENSPAERVRANNAGLNWQADYADRMLRRGFADRGLSAFSAADYLLNANYWLTYSAKDKHKDRPLRHGGDTQDLAEHLESHHGVGDALDKMVRWSALSALLSAANWQAIQSMSDYVHLGTTGLFDGRLSWSFLNYGYEDSFSLSSTFHFRPSDRNESWIFGLETSVIGKEWTEIHFGKIRNYDRGSLESILVIGKDGALLELTAEGRLTDRLAVVAAATLHLDGKTRRGSRLITEGDELIQLGMSWTF